MTSTLKKLILSSFVGFMALSSQVLAQNNVTAVFNGTNNQVHLGAAWKEIIDGAPNTGDNTYLTATGGTGNWNNENPDNNLMRFVTSETFASLYPGSTLGTNKTLKYSMGAWYMSGVIVDTGATGYSLTNDSSGHARNILLNQAVGHETSYFDINENFAMSVNSTNSNADARDINLSNVDSVMEIATDKTFTINATLAGSSARTLNISGGGTLDYNYNNGDRATRANFKWDISGAGTTLDLQSVSNAQVNLALGSGVTQLSDGATLSVANDATISAYVQIGNGGGTIETNGSDAGTVTTTNLHIKQGQTLTLGAGDTLTNGNITLTGSITADHAAISITDTMVTGLDLTSTNIVIADGAAITLSNAVLGSALSLSGGATANIHNSRLTGLSIAATEPIDFATVEGHDVTGITAYTISGVTDILDGATTASGKLTLDFTGFSGFTEPEDGQLIAFIQDDVTNLADILDSGYYNDVVFKFGDYSSAAMGFAVYDGKVMLYIPEPGTATLSILALAGLVMRRRRKS